MTNKQIRGTAMRISPFITIPGLIVVLATGGFGLTQYRTAPAGLVLRPALGRPETSHRATALTFADRIGYQRAIEEVYWRHRIWPKERVSPKPPLDEVILPVEIEEKVRAYLRNSQWLEEDGRMPLSQDQLQQEIDRMIRHTKQPAMLREIFEALGNNPDVIAECFARPVLAQRLINNSSDNNETLKRQIEYSAVRAKADMTIAAAAHAPLPTAKNSVATGPYVTSLECADDTWSPTSTANAPAGRGDHTTVWTGSEMIVWGGIVCSASNCGGSNTGGKYDPTTDTWTPTSTTNAPAGRGDHTAIWTGTQMIVWGGYITG